MLPTLEMGKIGPAGSLLTDAYGTLIWVVFRTS